MSMKSIAFSLSALALFLSAQVAQAGAFSNMRVTYVEVDSATLYAGGPWIVLQISNSSGPINLCSTASSPTYMRLPTSDAGAKSILQVALLAKATNATTVAGNGLEPPAGEPFCRIGNLGLY